MLWQIVLSRNGHVIILIPICSSRILPVSIKRQSLLPSLWTHMDLCLVQLIEHSGDNARWLPRLNHKKKFLFLSAILYFSITWHLPLETSHHVVRKPRPYREATCRYFSQHVQVRSQGASLQRIPGSSIRCPLPLLTPNKPEMSLLCPALP